MSSDTSRWLLLVFLQVLLVLLLPLVLAGCSYNLQGEWHGTSDYFNAPFTAEINQSNTGSLGGVYQDLHDKGSIDGMHNGSANVLFRANFGDTGLLFEGKFIHKNEVEGTLTRTGGVHKFTMVR